MNLAGRATLSTSMWFVASAAWAQDDLVASVQKQLTAETDEGVAERILRDVPPAGGTLTIESRIDALAHGLDALRPTTVQLTAIELLSAHVDHEAAVAQLITACEALDERLSSLDRKAFRRRSSIPTFQRFVGQREAIKKQEGLAKLLVLLGRSMDTEGDFADTSDEEIQAKFDEMRAALTSIDNEERVAQALTQSLVAVPNADAASAVGRILAHSSWNDDSLTLVDRLLTRGDRAGFKAIAARIKQAEGAIAEIAKRKPKKPGKMPKMYVKKTWQKKIQRDRAKFESRKDAAIDTVRTWCEALGTRLRTFGATPEVDLAPPEKLEPFSAWTIWAGRVVRKLP